MTPMQVRKAEYGAAIYCRPCRMARSLRLGVVPKRYQHIDLREIPLRCLQCGERAKRIVVSRTWGGRLDMIWDRTRPLDEDGL